MKVTRVLIKNFRCFENFELLDLTDSITVVAANAGGKTTLLDAIGFCLSGARGLTPRDFRDSTQRLTLEVTLAGILPDDQGDFGDAVDFGGRGATVDLGVRAIWDEYAEQLDLTWGYPRRDWARAGRAVRERIPFIWLRETRDPARIAALTGSTSLLQRILKSVDLAQPLDDAVSDLEQTMATLAATPTFATLLGDFDTELATLVPDVNAGAFDLEAAAASPNDLLSHFQLALSHFGPHKPVAQQSSGLGQLAIFVLALRIAAVRPPIVLVDEPENSLHPQAQRSATQALHAATSQVFLATHSASVLSGVDAREVVRLKRTGDTEARRPTGLTDDDAVKLARYATSETAEAFFARTVLLVEGPSDYLAVREAARILGVDLDGKAVSIVSLQGAGLLETYLRLLGPSGLDLELAGLCDLDAESDWRNKLAAAGCAVHDRTTMNVQGFFICDRDLEAELVAAHGDQAVLTIINGDGEGSRYAAFANQPLNRGLSTTEQLEKFARGNKTRWSPRLMGALTARTIPQPIKDLLARV